MWRSIGVRVLRGASTQALAAARGKAYASRGWACKGCEVTGLSLSVKGWGETRGRTFDEDGKRKQRLNLKGTAVMLLGADRK